LIFAQFDHAYLEKLRAHDTETEVHFTKYFGELLFLKLRNKLRSVQLIDDVRQETLLRVLKIVRERGVDHPERLGAFVHSVCNNVMYEEFRKQGRHLQMAEDAPEPRDERVDLDAPLLGEEVRDQVEAILDALPAKDRSVLRMIYLEEVPKEEICRLLHVDQDYLRVLLHRAKSRFRAEFLKRDPGTGRVREGKESG